MIQKDLLVSKKAVIYPENSDRRSRGNDDAFKRSDDNIENREDKFVVHFHSMCIEFH